MNLMFCFDCAAQEACENPNVAGYLTVPQYKKYKKDAERLFQFMKDGYIVLDINEWRKWSLYTLDSKPLKDLLEGSPAGSKKSS